MKHDRFSLEVINFLGKLIHKHNEEKPNLVNKFINQALFMAVVTLF